MDKKDMMERNYEDYKRVLAGEVKVDKNNENYGVNK